MLNGLDVFVRVVEEGGFAAAATKLGRSNAYVSKQVSKLEERLQTRLLTRTTRSVTLTEAGQVYFDQVRDIVHRAEEAAHDLLDSRSVPHGLLRVSAPVSFGLGYLQALLPEFLTANPDVSLELELEDRIVDVVSGGYDLAIRVGEIADTSLVSRRIAQSFGVVVAAPAYWQRRGRPARPSDLADHDCIGFTLAPHPDRWTFAGPGGESLTVRVPIRISTNSAELECSFARSGLGVAHLPDFACAKDVRQGRLEPVLADYRSTGMAIHALYPERRHLPAKTRAFLDFLISHLTRKFG